jgi:hypothetical protein
MLICTYFFLNELHFRFNEQLIFVDILTSCFSHFPGLFARDAYILLINVGGMIVHHGSQTSESG